MRKIVSLFDGIGGARQALSNLGVSCSYLASEVDRPAIKVVKRRFPDVLQLGDVNTLSFNVSVFKNTHLLVGGSPCQNLSSAGNGEGLSGVKSRLFWKYIEALRVIKPKYFLFENVASMVGDTKDRISKELGVEPVLFDSQVVSAQRRPRYYWCNFPIQSIGTRQQLFIQDILDDNPPEGCFVNERLEIAYSQIPDGGCWRDLPDDNVEKKAILATRARAKANGLVMGGQSSFFRKYGLLEKCPCLTASGTRQTMTRIVWRDPYKNKHRYPSALEAERLQTFPDGYTEGEKESERFKMLGNSFTVKVIEEILKNII